MLLIGGDKVRQWEVWYTKNIPIADRLDDEWLQDLGNQDPERRRTQ